MRAPSPNPLRSCTSVRSSTSSFTPGRGAILLPPLALLGAARPGRQRLWGPRMRGLRPPRSPPRPRQP
eukprot:3856040-Pyramimonas_sp.AAC.1